MKKVRNIRWHTVLIDTLKTETSNFVLNPSLPTCMCAPVNDKVCFLREAFIAHVTFIRP